MKLVSRLSVIVACLALVVTTGVASAQTAPAPTPAAPAEAPAGAGVNAAGTRYDWQGNHKKAQAALAARDHKTAIQLFTSPPRRMVAPFGRTPAC